MERPSKPGLAIGVGLIALAALIAWNASQMTVPPSYARVGPQIVPYIVAAGLALVGACTAWRAAAAGWTRPVAEERHPTAWSSLLIISAGLIVHFLLLRTAGFVLMAIVLFMTVAYGFGSRRYLRDALVAVVLAFAAYFGFTRGLGLQLPTGLWAGMI